MTEMLDTCLPAQELATRLGPAQPKHTVDMEKEAERSHGNTEGNGNESSSLSYHYVNLSINRRRTTIPYICSFLDAVSPAYYCTWQTVRILSCI
jgi:hypothetical protein